MPSRRRREIPIGRSLPGSMTNPKPAKPFGALSLQIEGNADRIQNGGSAPPTGDSSDTPGSLPIDPYLKCSSMLS